MKSLGNWSGRGEGMGRRELEKWIPESCKFQLLSEASLGAGPDGKEKHHFPQSVCPEAVML